jgi:dipeptidyl-peptidase-3
MKKVYIGGGLLLSCSVAIQSCNTDVVKEPEVKVEATNEPLNNNPNIANADFKFKADRFADIQVLRYKINDFDKLSLNQKKLVYFLSQAGLAGRDIGYDQNFKYNLEIRKAFEKIVSTHDNNDPEFAKVLEYAKRMWFANGIHHHYGMAKFKSEFSKEQFASLLTEAKTTLSPEAIEAIFSDKYLKRKDKNPAKDMIAASANNFYGDGVTQKMVEDFYASKIDKTDKKPISYGLNSTMELVDGKLTEVVWKSGGKYGKSIDQIIHWLEKAVTVAENESQKKGFELLIEYYKTGDLKLWDEYNIVWAGSTEGDIDYINGFIEVYGDALGYRATYESIVQITDFDASARMKVVEDNVQWFEDNSTIMAEHKKKEVKGVTYKVIQTAAESGDASPSTPIGVNLPNANWIRAGVGSKSVSLGNIIEAYNESGGS